MVTVNKNTITKSRSVFRSLSDLLLSWTAYILKNIIMKNPIKNKARIEFHLSITCTYNIFWIFLRLKYSIKYSLWLPSRTHSCVKYPRIVSGCCIKRFFGITFSIPAETFPLLKLPDTTAPKPPTPPRHQLKHPMNPYYECHNHLLNN